MWYHVVCVMTKCYHSNMYQGCTVIWYTFNLLCYRQNSQFKNENVNLLITAQSRATIANYLGALLISVGQNMASMIIDTTESGWSLRAK